MFLYSHPKVPVKAISLREGSIDIAEQVGLVLVKSFEGDELAHVRGGQRRWTSELQEKRFNT